MSKVIVGFFLLSFVLVSQAGPTYFLVSQWMDYNNRFCEYNNGTVLNVGSRPCPPSIR